MTWPRFEQDELDAVQAVLRSGRVNYWTGREGRSFEREFAAYCGAAHGVALANGTLALELALRALGVGSGDDVLVTPRSFFASAGAIMLTGGRPVFADVDTDSQNVTVETLGAAITPETKAIVVVHLAGWPCDMDAIGAFAASNGLAIVEDCAQAHGASWRGRKVGSFGDAAAFSFCQDKIMTTGGEGGMLLTRAEDVWKRAWSYKDHGKNWDKVQRDDHPPGFRWLHDTLGTNWRMTEMQAAIGRCQLRKLPAWLEIRRRNARLLSGALEGVAGLRVPSPPAEVSHAFYKFYFFVEPQTLRSGWNRDRIMSEISAHGVPCFSGSCPEIYRERVFEGASSRPSSALPGARQLGQTSLVLLVDPSHDCAQIERAAHTVSKVMASAVR
jgi:dTDP-4-amino-4,6-dideoxygalactose transaminase